MYINIYMCIYIYIYMYMYCRQRDMGILAQLEFFHKSLIIMTFEFVV